MIRTGMNSQIPHFPAEIRALPDFDGPFDAYRLQAEGCEVLFAIYPAGTSIARRVARSPACIGRRPVRS